MAESWPKNVPGEIVLSLQYDRSWLSPDLPLIWLKMYNLLRESDERKWFQLLFSLPAMAFSSSSLSELVPVFVAFASHPQFRLEDPPHYDSYPIWKGCYPSFDTLREHVVASAHSIVCSPERLEPVGYEESLANLKDRQLRMYNKRLMLDANATAQRLLEAWPCETPPQCLLDSALYHVADLESKIQQHFSDIFRNLKFKEHLIRVQMILSDLHSKASPPRGTPLFSFHPSQSIPSCIPWLLTMDQLFARPAPPLPTHSSLPRHAADVRKTSLSNPPLLHQLISTVRENAVNPFQRRYVSALHTSAESFGSEVSLITHDATRKLPTADTPLEHYARCSASYITTLHQLQRYLGPKSQSEQAVEQSGQWPRLTPHVLFGCLASNSPIILPDNWRKCFVRFALLALELQRARRLFLLHIGSLHEDLCRELKNKGCDGWDAEAHQDWLLIQVCFYVMECLLMPSTSRTSAARQFFDSPHPGRGCL